ncbi:MAG: hypothetical protein TREMPRED_002724 [Tremellales sp. Tagirdzhanova-0007]|nr:MAG: hypothetical protein TREMPRED_002724 [Tremellales sp. Tagirdzhanova-0007]
MSLTAILEAAAVTREQNRRHTNAFIQEHVNTANTRKAYSSAQARYLKFCKEKYPGQANPATVTADKIIMFLFTESSRQMSSAGGGTVGASSLVTARAAIIKLFDEQERAGENNNAHPSMDPSLRAMMKAFKRQIFNRSRETYADKAKGSIVEHLLSSTQLISIQDAFVPEGWKRSGRFQ